MRYLLILLLFACNQEYPEPKKEISFIVGTWHPKDSISPKYIFYGDNTGKRTMQGNWYDITYKLDNSSITINFLNRESKYYIFDQTNQYFKMGFNLTEYSEYYKK